MMASLSGHGYCVPCADPIQDIPLMPVTQEPRRFIQIRTAYLRAVREYNKDVQTWHLSRTPDGRIVRQRREDPREAEELLIPLARTGLWERKSPGGRPRALTASDEQTLLRMVKTRSFPSVPVLARVFSKETRRAKRVSRQTLTRFLRDHRLKLTPRPARRS